MRSALRAPSSKKGRKVRALEELASELQRQRFFESLKANGDDKEARRKAGITWHALGRLLKEDRLFLSRYEEIKGCPDSKKRKFLNTFAAQSSPDELKAAREAGISLATFKRALDTDPEFARDYSELLEEHEAAMVARLGEEGVGKEGRSANVPALIQAIRDRFPHRLRPQPATVRVVSVEDIDAMSPDELKAYIAKREKDAHG